MSQDHNSSPVTASKPLMTPEGASSVTPSVTWWPVTMTSRTTVGGELMATMPGSTAPMPFDRRTSPFSPKPWQRSPVFASSEITEPRSVPRMIRVAQGLSALAVSTS